ncbi:sugar phosphate isomerase/epimerase family protein [Paenibacillus cremeus]|uniref:Sugar phosphate isomerase/epimerase n=1 Tax=Paenibacillus cremeus TaxID=2163881 RepID=A0A559K7B2_9BACL|nr:sugar phosphate isomerase/epimerase family protein [Paenibacillus cremeus]TVY08016.1 sugar phosphate isomerase/epimerase [Paenibacillus cremeus]
MLKGLNQWCFPVGTPLEHIFDTCQKAGYDAVELNMYEPGGVGLTIDSTAAEVESIGALARKYGLQLRSLSTGLFGKYQLSSKDESIREAALKTIRKQLEIASLLGIDTILVIPGRVNDEISYDVCYTRSQEELKKVVPDAEKYGIYLGIENVWNKFLQSPLEMARYIDELQSPYAAAYYDVGNTLSIGFPDQWIRILGSRIKKVHVKDFKPNVGNYNGFVPLLAGDVPWARVRQALRDIGYTDTLTAELDAYASTPDQLIYDTARHIDFIIHGEVR